MKRTAARTRELLEVLCDHEVAFIVVGMTAGVLQGAPAVTFDLDVLYANTAGNRERLETVLTKLGASDRDPAGRRIEPTAAHLEPGGHNLLTTELGDRDLLGSIEDGATYEGLLGDTVVLDVDGRAVRVLTLARLIATREKTGREKDLATLPLLRSTLERSRKG